MKRHVPYLLFALQIIKKKGIMIIEEAGGVVTTVDGKPVRLDTLCSVKATNGVAE